ncbi:Lrp/AsnC family transcriptional regulator [Steroidobacter sp.]|uniref:Lrp/AsnC family transcriptional regulator n=1 Tax=Steroidobacter sp. TaxID=1978227 RepID=UPI0032C222EE
MKIDQIDRRILRALQKDGRLQNVELAKRVGLSPSPCLRRVRRLEEAGVIDRYAALLDASKIGVNLTVFARISLISQDAETVERFTNAMRNLPQVVECYVMAGECDALLRVVAADLDDYRRFQSTHLTRVNAVQTVKTDIPLQKIKLSSELPL